MTDRKLRFLFIQPEFHRHYVPFFPVYEPLHGLLFGAIVRDLAETRIFDRRFDSDENLAGLLEDYRPDIIGFTTHTPGEIENVKRLAALVKDKCPRAVTIVGGQHATLLPEDLFDPAVDLICIGPGEDTFREVVQAMAGDGKFSDIAGLVVKRGIDYLITAPREIRSGTFSWPSFDRNLLPAKYLKHYIQCFERRTTVYTITTSGCPHRCNFCALWAIARGTYRRRSPEEIVQDIASQAQPYVHLTDDNTFDNEAHAREICRLLKKYKVKKKILAYARSDTIVNKADLIKEWSEAGLGALVVGMEAVSDKYLESINKKSSVTLNIDAHRIMEELNIENWAHFVIMPEFEKSDFDEIWDFVDRLNITYPVFAAMTPVPGTPLFFEVKKEKKITCFDYGFYNLQYMVLETKLPKEEWYQHFWDLYRKSCSPKTLWRRRKSRAFHWRPAVLRAAVMKNTMFRIKSHVKEQLSLERTQSYEEIEKTLPPSLRSDYQADKYYNATSIAELKKASQQSTAEEKCGCKEGGGGGCANEEAQ